MGIIIDVTLLAILILNIYIGYKKGLVNVVFNIAAFLISIIATLILFKPVSMIILNNTKIAHTIEQSIINNFQETDSQKTSNIIESKIKEMTTDTRNEAVEVVAKNISTRVVEIITSIVLFIGIRIALILLKFLTETISELPIIKQFNQAGGIVYGALKGIVIIYLILTIIFLIVSVKGNGIISKTINETHITKFLYENNIIVKYCLLGKNLL